MDIQISRLNETKIKLTFVMEKEKKMHERVPREGAIREDAGPMNIANTSKEKLKLKKEMNI